MAIISFTASDALQTTVVPAANYPTEISAIDGPKKSSSGKSVNYFVDVTITEGTYKGKTRTIVFNSETNSPSLLGEMQFYPQAYFLIVNAAITGKKVEPADFQLDTDTLLHKPFVGQWGVGTVEGRLINVINGFQDTASASASPAF
jgi:hypothetical protein